MADASALVWLLVVVIVIEGVWLAGLTYLIWRGRTAKKEATAPAEPPKET